MNPKYRKQPDFKSARIYLKQENRLFMIVILNLEDENLQQVVSFACSLLSIFSFALCIPAPCHKPYITSLCFSSLSLLSMTLASSLLVSVTTVLSESEGFIASWPQVLNHESYSKELCE